MVSKTFFSDDIENIVVSGQSFEKDILDLSDKGLKARRSLKYLMKENILGQKFADTYFFDSEKKYLED